MIPNEHVWETDDFDQIEREAKLWIAVLRNLIRGSTITIRPQQATRFHTALELLEDTCTRASLSIPEDTSEARRALRCALAGLTRAERTSVIEKYRKGMMESMGERIRQLASELENISEDFEKLSPDVDDLLRKLRDDLLRKLRRERNGGSADE